MTRALDIPPGPAQDSRHRWISRFRRMPQDTKQPDGPSAGALGEYLGRAWRRIPAHFKKAFALVLGVNILVFAYLLIQHPLGNHDLFRLPWIEYRNQVSVGRWFCFVLYLLVGHAQLPVFNQFLAIVFHIVSGMAAAIYWKRAGRAFPLAVAGLAASLVPFVLSHFYYSYQSFCFGAAQCLALGGLIAAARATPAGVAGGAALILCALASYQPVLSVAAVALLLYALLALSDARARGESPAPFRFLAAALAPGALALAAGGVLYRASLAVCRRFGWIDWGAYQLREADWHYWPQRLARSLQAALEHLVLPQPYMLLTVKLILLALLVLAAGAILRRLLGARTAGPGARRLQYAGWGLLLLVAAVWATKSIVLFSPLRFYFAFRLSGGLTFLYVFAMLLAMEAPRPRVRALAAALSAGALLLFAYQDLVHQGLVVRSNDHDMHLANRLLSRIERLPRLDPDETYSLVVIGDLPLDAMPRYRERDFLSRKPADYMDEHSMLPPWEPELMFAMLGSTLSLQTPWKTRDQEVLWQQACQYALQHASWPHRESVALLEGNLVVVILEKDVAKLAKEYTRRAPKLLAVKDEHAPRVAAAHEDIRQRIDRMCSWMDQRVRRRLDWVARQQDTARAEWTNSPAAGARPGRAAERLLRETDEELLAARNALDRLAARPDASTAEKLAVLQELDQDTIPRLWRNLRATRGQVRAPAHDGG
ncbi:MAG: glucosyltransferase domain-containing protein [Kiritimatiellae bacterium]|nr:glucosyltransferase domain-containing protein [Kiritimatiellia bacterium]